MFHRIFTLQELTTIKNKKNVKSYVIIDWGPSDPKLYNIYCMENNIFFFFFFCLLLATSDSGDRKNILAISKGTFWTRF